MSASLVGSEMCIRDSPRAVQVRRLLRPRPLPLAYGPDREGAWQQCLDAVGGAMLGCELGQRMGKCGVQATSDQSDAR
eukprot:12468728-Alexandrium_andersonii.AAC.1